MSQQQEEPKRVWVCPKHGIIADEGTEVEITYHRTGLGCYRMVVLMHEKDVLNSVISTGFRGF